MERRRSSYCVCGRHNQPHHDYGTIDLTSSTNTPRRSACARATLTDSLRLSLLEAMDSRCAAAGSPFAATFAKPAAFLCTELLAPAPTCARSTTLTGASGGPGFRSDTAPKLFHFH